MLVSVKKGTLTPLSICKVTERAVRYAYKQNNANLLQDNVTKCESIRAKKPKGSFNVIMALRSDYIHR